MDAAKGQKVPLGAGIAPLLCFLIMAWQAVSVKSIGRYISTAFQKIAFLTILQGPQTPIFVDGSICAARLQDLKRRVPLLGTSYFSFCTYRYTPPAKGAKRVFELEKRGLDHAKQDRKPARIAPSCKTET